MAILGAFLLSGIVCPNFENIELASVIDGYDDSGPLNLVSSPGSGKTTLLKVLATLYLPDGGMNRVLDMDLVRDAPLIRERISFISPGLDFQRKLTLEENLKFFAKVQNPSFNFEQYRCRRVSGLIS